MRLADARGAADCAAACACGSAARTFRAELGLAAEATAGCSAKWLDDRLALREERQTLQALVTSTNISNESPSMQAVHATSEKPVRETAPLPLPRMTSRSGAERPCAGLREGLRCECRYSRHSHQRFLASGAAGVTCLAFV